MDNSLYLFEKIVGASNKKNMSLKVDADVLLPMSLLRCDQFGTCDNAHDLPIQWYNVYIVLPT
jgi:hypothetical protein